MIRPSSLSIAKHCDLAPVLSERYPSVSDATERGNAVDAQVTAFVQHGTAPTDPDAKACVEWICATFDPTAVEMHAQEKVALVHGGKLVTEGTADLIVEQP
jgi:hypothetical protein